MKRENSSVRKRNGHVILTIAGRKISMTSTSLRFFPFTLFRVRMTGYTRQKKQILKNRSLKTDPSPSLRSESG
jgi:hypothetical protein